MIECGYNVIGCALVYRVADPALALKPDSMAAGLTGWNDILIHTIAHHNNLVGIKAQCLYAKCEYLWIGLANAYHSTLDDSIKNAIEAELAKYCGDIAIEVAYQYHGVTLLQLQQNLATAGCLIAGDSIQIINHSLLILRQTKELKFYTYLLLERALEGKIGLNDRILAQSALGMYISLAELLLANRHLLALVSMPYDLAPVLSTSVERTTIVEYVTFNHRGGRC